MLLNTHNQRQFSTVSCISNAYLCFLHSPYIIKTNSVSFTGMKNTSFLKSCLELSALLATACGRFLFKDVLVLKLIFMLTATLVWFCYFLYTYRTDKKRFKSWGISFQNFNSTFKELFPFLLFFILLFVLLGYGLNITTLSWRILPALLIYPLWGMLQQIMIIGLFTFLLKQFFPTISNTLIILLTAVTFSLVHYPSTILMPGTLVMALVYTYLYLNGRNLLVLGIFHGWLGAFFFYCLYQWNSFMVGFAKF